MSAFSSLDRLFAETEATKKVAQNTQADAKRRTDAAIAAMDDAVRPAVTEFKRYLASHGFQSFCTSQFDVWCDGFATSLRWTLADEDTAVLFATPGHDGMKVRIAELNREIALAAFARCFEAAYSAKRHVG